MKIVSDNLKKSLKQPTTQRKGKILINDKYYEVYNVEYYADAYNEGNVIGNAIASQLDFDLPYMEKFDTFKYFDGVWTGRDYEFVDMGTFTVVDEKDEDEFNKHITSFDNLIKFNAPFEDKKDYPKTLFQELQNICSQAGVELVNTSIVNGSFIVENNQFAAGENLKTVLKNICGVSGTYATIKNDKLVLQLQNKTNEVMNKGQHEPIEWKRKTYGINQVVIGLKDVGGEYVVKQDNEDITKNGVHKLVINDNYFAYTQEKRQQLIDGLFEQVKGFGYVPYDLKSEWLNYMDIGDTITIDDVETIILRIKGKSPKSLESEMSAPAIIDSAVNYVDNTDTLANQQRRTELWVDKQLGEIGSIVSNVETTVQDITTTTQTSTGGNSLHIIDALESNALEYHIDGESEQEISLEGTNKFDDSVIIGMVMPTTAGTLTTRFPIKNTLKNNTDYYVRLFINNVVWANNRIEIQFYDNNDTLLAKIATKTDVINSSNLSTASYLTMYVNASGVSEYGGQSITGLVISESDSTTYSAFTPNSPSPDYPSEIKTIKGIENLFDKDNTDLLLDDVGINATTGVVSNISGYYSLVIDCKPNTIYTVSKKASARFVIAYSTKDSINANDTLTVLNANYTTTILSGTTGNDAKKLFVMYSKASEETITKQEILDSIMIEEGSIAHDYVPYGAWAKVKVTGKNKLNPNELISGGYSISNGEFFSSETSFCTNKKIKIDNTKSYYLSHNVNNANQYYYVLYYDENENYLGHISSLITTKTMDLSTYTNYSQAKYINIRFDAPISYINDIQLEEDGLTEYEEYKEQEVLIDLSKPNLFDKDNAENSSAYNFGTIGVIPEKIASTTRCSLSPTNAIKVEPNTTYTFKNKSDWQFSIGELSSDKTLIKQTDWKNNIEYTFTTSSTTEYICLNFALTSNATITDELFNEYVNFIKIYEGYTDYYELSSIGDTKDTLDIVNGQVVIDKKIGKIVLDGSESWAYISEKKGATLANYIKVGSPYAYSTHFVCANTWFTWIGENKFGFNTDSVLWIQFGDKFTTVAEFKTWLGNNNVSLYYELAESEQIVLPNTNVELYEGINHITLVDDLETTTSIKFLRQTPISNEYATNQQLNETNYNLANTTSQSNENTANINATNTNLNNNYYTKPQIDIMNTATTEEITTIKKEVETKITAEDLNIAINKVQITGATSVTTTTGYTFNEDGLSIKKSGNEMSSTLDNDGLVVKRNETEVLTVRSSGVQTENLTVRTYFTIGDNTRAENYKGGTGFFYIGGDD